MTRVVAAGICSGLLTFSLFAQDPTELVALKYGSFDPAADPEPMAIEPTLRGDKDTNLWIVQFATTPTERMREAIRDEGGEVHGYLPENAHVVRMPIGIAASIRGQADVRSVTYYHPAFRLEEQLRFELRNNSAPERRYNIVVVDKRTDKPALARNIAKIGGKIDSDGGGSLLFQVTLDGPQLLQAARLDQVLWIDRWTAPEDDMDNARIQGGADYVESLTGYTGQGIVGHQMEGLQPSHVDWNNTPISWPPGCNSVNSHGHNTAGIVYGNGSSSPLARGMAPDAQAIYTSCRTNRYNNFQSLISNYGIMFTTASWGASQTPAYTSVSAEADDICFDQDIIWTNSQSNTGDQRSRPEAWAKNVFAIGGLRHNNNANPADDSWGSGSSRASIGPAADGRTKPELCAYYDGIATSSSNGSFTTGFGGTSGATPIVAGHNAIAIQMFTDGVFGNPPRVPGGTRFQNKPHFSTLKALQVVSAEQYSFNASSTDNKREHQGYGFPNLRNMYDDRNQMVLVDEDDVLAQGDGVAYVVAVPAGRQSLKISMSYSDPAGNPAAARARINDLTLRVTSPSGASYWGNAGLATGMWSTTTGERDRINTVENVFVSSPQAGNWTVEVIAYVIAEDTHVETPAIDADFGLAVRGATLASKSTFTVPVGAITAFGQGCTGSAVLPTFCSSVNPNGGVLTQESRNYVYAYQSSTATTETVTGFDMFTASIGGGTVNVTAALYFDAGGRPATNAAATTTMTVGGTQAFYNATFPTPVVVPAGSTYYVAISHTTSNVYISTLTSGTTRQCFYLAGNGWLPSGVATEPSFRVYCQGGGGANAVPSFDLTGTPEVGQSIELDVRLAVASSPAALLVGRSNTTWNGFPLPIDLGLIGATGCDMLVSGDSSIGLATDSNGAIDLTIQIPLSSALAGFQAFLQVMIADPAANTLGVVSTRGQALTIGS